MQNNSNGACPSEDRCAALEKELEYYKRLTNEIGRKRLREIGQLNRLISELKNAEEALVQNQRLSAVAELASGVAHDFNNLLQSIFGNIDLALLCDVSPELRSRLEAIKHSAEDAGARVRQLQRFAGTSDRESAYEKLDLNRLVQDVLSQSRPLWAGQPGKPGTAVRIDRHLSDHALYVMGNRGDLRSVLLNLVKNSIEEMPDGGRLGLETLREQDNACLLVTDTGKGMDRETRTRIFQPFFSHKGFEQGRGLGLSSAYAMVREHGGELRVKDSAPGKGTSMQILLPLAGPSTGPAQQASPEYQGKARVLWVDDEKVVRQVGKAQLETLGHEAGVARNGEEALELLAAEEYDLMVTDIGMPGMSGWELAKTAKERWPDMKIAVVTGWAADITAEEQEQCVGGYVLKKPISMDQLNRLVGEVLQLKRK